MNNVRKSAAVLAGMLVVVRGPCGPSRSKHLRNPLRRPMIK
jgi:hypothetical protein